MLMNKLKSTGLLIDKKQKRKRRVITEEKLDDIGARLQHTPIKSLNMHLLPGYEIRKNMDAITWHYFSDKIC
jgi:hypothetical protein